MTGNKVNVYNKSYELVLDPWSRFYKACHW